MLLVHRKVIIYSLVSMVFIATSFYMSSPDGVFFMSIIGCYFSFLVISRYGFGSEEDYRLKIYAGLQERVKYGIGDKNWNLLCKKKDWHSMIYLPAIFIILASGFILSPSRIFGKEPGGIDIVFYFLGLVVLHFTSNHESKKENEMIQREIDKLYDSFINE